MAADAYHRVSNKLGVAIATSGPDYQSLELHVHILTHSSLYITGAPVSNQLRINKKIRQIGMMEVVDL